MLKGFFRLDRIPRSEIRQTEKGAVGVFIEIHEKREKDNYGYTHYAKMRVKNENGEYENVYLGDFRFEELKLKSAEIDLSPINNQPEQTEQEPKQQQKEENNYPF